jgi:hypothetical protein
MNERIKELAEQAGVFAGDFAGAGLYSIHNKEEVEKFAELIVQECAGLFPNVYVEIETDYGHTPVIAADYIKKHFGVEE